MIVVDENIHDQRIINAISRWYPGQVVSVTTLRPGSLIKDDAIPTLLLGVDRATFVTINVADFWRRVRAHSQYCIVTVTNPGEELHEIPTLLRQLFRMPQFKSRSNRMGKVIRVGHRRLDFYEADRRIRRPLWP